MSFRKSGVTAKRKLKPSDELTRPLPWRYALALGVLVTLAHLALLGSAALPMRAQPQAKAAEPVRMSTRRVQPSADPAARTQPGASAPRARPAAAAAGGGAAWLLGSGTSQDATGEAPADQPSASPAPDAQQSQGLAQAPAPAPAQPDLDARPAPPQPFVPQEMAEAAEAAGTTATEVPDLQAADTPAAAAPQDTTAAPPPTAARDLPALRLPGPVRLRYELIGRTRGLAYSAEGVLSWQHDGQRYEASMGISGLLLVRPRVMRSSGELGPQGVAPRRFSDKSRTEQATHFQPELGRIVFSSNAPPAPWQAGAQDRVSLFFQLAGLLAGAPERFPTGSIIELWTAGVREAGPWIFTVTGQPTLSLPVGEQVTVALRREPRRDYDQTIEVWLAPALGYLPARIRITQGNGDVIDQQLAAVEPL